MYIGLGIFLLVVGAITVLRHPATASALWT